jgi:glycosyltransferase involved in cell wall biosynthesis
MLDLLIMEDRVAEPWRIVNGLDVAMLIGGPLNTMDLRGAGSPFAALIGGGRRLRPMPGVMPLLWAMSAGVPVIAEASSAVSDIVDDGQTGLLVGQHDVNAAADRLCRIHDDPTIAGRLGMNARGFVQKNFHVSSFCVRLKDFYQRLTAARAGALVGHGNDDVIEQRDPHSMKWQRI